MSRTVLSLLKAAPGLLFLLAYCALPLANWYQAPAWKWRMHLWLCCPFFGGLQFAQTKGLASPGTVNANALVIGLRVSLLEAIVALFHLRKN